MQERMKRTEMITMKTDRKKTKQRVWPGRQGSHRDQGKKQQKEADEEESHPPHHEEDELHGRWGDHQHPPSSSELQCRSQTHHPRVRFQWNR